MRLNCMFDCHSLPNITIMFAARHLFADGFRICPEHIENDKKTARHHTVQPGSMMLPTGSLHFGFGKDIFLNSPSWNFPDAANPHCLEFAGFQNFINRIHPASQQFRRFFRGNQSVIIIKHHTEPPFGTLPGCYQGNYNLIYYNAC